jgi:hypothetical protein
VQCILKEEGTIASRPRSARTAGVLVSTTVVSLALISGAPAQAVTGPEAAVGQFAHAAKLNIGDEATPRACTATLVDEWWIATAAGCFAQSPGQQVPAGKPAP